MSTVTDSADTVLADILKNPSKRLLDICETDSDPVAGHVREVMRLVATSPFKQVDGVDEAPPLLVDRLSFAWNLLAKADTNIKKASVSKDKATSTVDFLRQELTDNLLDNPIGPLLLEAIFELLGVDAKGQFLELYREFLKPNAPKKIGINVMRADGSLSVRNVKRLIRWIIRKLNMKYVYLVEGQIVVHVPFLMEKVSSQFYDWSGVKKEACDSDQIKEFVNDGISEWLAYSCLEGDALPQNANEQDALIKAFQKGNKLTAIVHITSPQTDPIKDRRIADLEAQVAKLNDEVRKKDSIGTADQDHPGNNAQAVRDLCKLIESKYPLDTLSDAQHSDDPMLSLRGVLSHLFFVLRRKGLVSYPTEDIFNLDYEKAGLYECIGFEIDPGDSREVEIVQRGWAIKSDDRLLPVHRAQVKSSENKSS